jgi:pyruvate/2-oxoglutarate dehydrogenase complex dihydrolipoamide acyltransferase (E2) component
MRNRVTDVHAQARDGKLTIEDMAGGTFTMCVALSVRVCIRFLAFRAGRPGLS